MMEFLEAAEANERLRTIEKTLRTSVVFSEEWSNEVIVNLKESYHYLSESHLEYVRAREKYNCLKSMAEFALCVCMYGVPAKSKYNVKLTERSVMSIPKGWKW